MRAGDVQLAWTRLELVDIESIFGHGRTVILAPHPDDESLGCGGMIAELCRIGRPPLVMVVTDGTGSHPNSSRVRTQALRRMREREAGDALWRLGLTDPGALVFMRLRDTAAPHEGPDFDRAVSRIAAFAAAFIGASWSSAAVVSLAALFGLSAFCWSGIGIAEAVRQASPAMVPEASAGVIGVTFFGALAGPTLFSAVTGLTGSAAAAFVIWALFGVAGTLLLLRPAPRDAVD